MKELTHILQSCFALLEIEKYLKEWSERVSAAMGACIEAGVYLVLVAVVLFICSPVVLPARFAIKLIGNNKRVNEVFSEYQEWVKNKKEEEMK